MLIPFFESPTNESSGTRVEPGILSDSTRMSKKAKKQKSDTPMRYWIKGSEVTLELAPEEISEVITSLELTNPESELLSDWRAFGKEEFA
jgi:hypothetical protein